MTRTGTKHATYRWAREMDIVSLVQGMFEDKGKGGRGARTRQNKMIGKKA